jgi:hypothetical protein
MDRPRATSIDRRTFTRSFGALLSAFLLAAAFHGAGASAQPADPLPSWNPGPARDGILTFVRQTTDRGSPRYVPPEERIASFDQDGTLWVEQPMYTQVK